MGASIADTELDDDSDFSETHDINVTPFIDVILVLLIIFMVAAPLSTVDLPIDLPSSTATPQKKPDKPTYVSIKPDLAVAIGETPVKRVDLVRSLDAMADASKDRFIFLRADRVGALWRNDGRARNPARRRLFEDQAGRARRCAGCGAVAAGASKPQTLSARGSEMSDLNTEQKPSRRLWIFAAVAALALHVGGVALAVAHLQNDDSDDSLGAPAIEVGLEMASPHLRSHRSAGRSGHRCVGRLRRRLPSKRPRSRKPSCRKDEPTETEDPDRVVTPNEFEEAEGRRSEDRRGADLGLDRVGRRRSDRHAEHRRPFRKGRVRSRRCRAPARARGACVRPGRRNWSPISTSTSAIPRSVRRKSAEILVSFALDRMGHVLATSIVKGSGDAAFDEAALAMVRSSDPVPMPPPRRRRRGTDLHPAGDLPGQGAELRGASAGEYHCR